MMFHRSTFLEFVSGAKIIVHLTAGVTKSSGFIVQFRLLAYLHMCWKLDNGRAEHACTFLFLDGKARLQ